MARPRSFCEQHVINAAMNAFWKHGYEATSMSELEAATGLKRISIYNAFGDKEGMYLAALDMYAERGREKFEKALPEAGLDGIIMLFKNLIQQECPDPPNHCGCLMANSLLDFHKASSPVKQRLLDFRAIVANGFRGALCNARQNQQISAEDAEIETRVAYLCSCLWGAIATIRIEQNPSAAKDFVTIVIATVEDWKSILDS